MKFGVGAVLLMLCQMCFGASTVPLSAVWTVNAHEGEVTDIAFSSNDEYVASAGADGLIKVRRVSDGQLWITHVAPFGYASAVAFPPGGNLFVASHSGGTIAWTLFPTSVLWTNEHVAADLAFSPDGRQIAGCYAGEYGFVFLMRSHDGHLLQTWLGFNSPGYQTITFTRTGHVLAGLLAGWTSLNVLRTNDWESERWSPGGANFILSPDGRLIAQPSTYSGEPLTTYDWSTGEVEKRFEGTNTTTTVCYLAEGRRVTATTSDGAIKVWDTGTGKLDWTYTGTGHAQHIASSPSGNYFAFGTISGQLVLAEAPAAIKGIRKTAEGLRLDIIGRRPARVQHRDDLSGAQWKDLDSAYIVSAGWQRYVIILNAEPGFYRLRDAAN